MSLQPEFSTRKEWAARRKLKQCRGRVCTCRLLGVRHRLVDYRNCLPPEADHCSLWNKDGRPEILLSEPYPISLNKVRAMVEFADQHGLCFHIHADGFWFPSQTLRIEWTRKEAP